MTAAPPERTARLRTALGQLQLDGYLTAHPADIAHLTGSTCAAAAYVPAEGRPEPCLLAVSLTEHAGAVAPEGYALLPHGLGETCAAVLAGPLRRAAPGRLSTRALDPHLERLAREVAAQAEDGDLLERLRRRQGRDTAEREGLARARRIAEAGVRALWAEARPGVRECDLAASIEAAMRRARAEPIGSTRLASGPRSAHAHAGPSPRVLQAGDLGFVHVHPQWEGYGADVARPFQLGEPSAAQLRITETLQRLHQGVLDLLRPGLTGAEVYAQALAQLEADGMAAFFSHRLGHPLGGLRHPQLAPGEFEALEVGDILSVGPGLYVPGTAGARIEDNVEITVDGAVVLTAALPRWQRID